MPRSLVRRPAPLLDLACAGALALLAACSSNPGPEMVPDAPVRIAPPTEPVKQGDCVEARRRAAAKPDLPVDQLPTPIALVPKPLSPRAMPAEVRAARYNAVSVTVIVDTLGRADMGTFTVVKSTHPWLVSNVKGAVAKWRFEPAQLAGCKVPRLYKWGATSGRPPR
jgi:hypothetical protein